jgi:hypothetical protein
MQSWMKARVRELWMSLVKRQLTSSVSLHTPPPVMCIAANRVSYNVPSFSSQLRT